MHFTTGISAVVCAIVMAKRPRDADGRMLARDVATALAGAAVLWFGWFALNAGSALASGNVLGLSFVTTQLGAAGGGLGWMVVEWSQRGRPTAIGVASGVVSGLVATTPAAGYVAPSAAIAIGFIAGAIGYGTGLGVVTGLVAGLLAITAAAGHVEPVMAIAIGCIAGVICHMAVMLKGRFGSSPVAGSLRRPGRRRPRGRAAHGGLRPEGAQPRGRGRSPLRKPEPARDPGGRLRGDRDLCGRS